MWAAFAVVVFGVVDWQHPAGLITTDTIREVQLRREEQPWATTVYQARREAMRPWVETPTERLKEVFPKRRSNVYHNFSCPQCRTRLPFNPFQPESFRCASCKEEFAPETDAGIYPPQDIYHGTTYDGWACLFYQTAADVAKDLAVMGLVEGNSALKQRAMEILLLFSDTIRGLPTDHAGEGQASRILTYHREGDNKILSDLAIAFELLRVDMPPDARERVQRDALARMLEDGMLERIYPYKHNNLYQWHRTILQTALALEREDLFDWVFGYGDFRPEKEPDHFSLNKIVAEHFKPDGAYWELCSGYHLYPLYGFCELAVLTRNLSRMDPERFCPAEYDLTDAANPGGQALKRALEWFMSMAMPDRTMTVVGDSTVPRAGMDSYDMTAEIGYRYFDVTQVGDYPALRNGQRTWNGLLFGADAITQKPTAFTSSCLSSGWVSLRNEWNGNRVWAGLNALEAGGSHQHADRLTLALFAHGELLALEKATPYNESTTRHLGTLTCSHNTVTVDGASQKQGEALTAEETPSIDVFFEGSFAKLAKASANRVYPNTTRYSRSVAIIEDLVVDFFAAGGGRQYDWVANLAGTFPVLSSPTDAVAFEPADWLANGVPVSRLMQCDTTWRAQWQTGAVTSRLTMVGRPGTEVYALQTYPVDNAVITESHPPCQTLCVRRRDDDTPFLAVWESWRETPRRVEVQAAGPGWGLMLRTEANTYYLLFDGGTADFPDGVTLAADASLAVLRNRDAFAIAGGRHGRVSTNEGGISMSLSATGSAETDWSGETLVGEKMNCIQYDTHGGQDHRRPSSMIELTLRGNLPAQKTQAQ